MIHAVLTLNVDCCYAHYMSQHTEATWRLNLVQNVLYKEYITPVLWDLASHTFTGGIQDFGVNL